MVITPKSYDDKALDQAITQAYSSQKPVCITFDLRHIHEAPNLRTLRSIKRVLDKHRQQTRQLLVHSTVVLENEFIANTARWVVPLLRPERPVHFQIN